CRLQPSTGDRQGAEQDSPCSFRNGGIRKNLCIGLKSGLLEAPGKPAFKGGGETGESFLPIRLGTHADSNFREGESDMLSGRGLSQKPFFLRPVFIGQC